MAQATRLKLCRAMYNLDLETSNPAIELEKRTKALLAVYKLAQTISEDEAKLEAVTVEKHKQNAHQLEHTPYDEIPPPSDTEMRAIQERLNSIYTQLRTAEDPNLCMD